MVLAVFCAVTYGVADYCGGRASREVDSTIVTALGQAVSLMLITAAVAVIGTPFPPTSDLAWGALGGVAGAVGLVSFYHALGHGSVTVVAPITAVVGIAIPVLVGLVQGDRPPVLAWFGMLCAGAAVALVSGALGNSGGMKTPTTILVAALVAGVGFGVIFAALAQTSAGSGMWPLAAARGVSVPLLLALVMVRRPAMTERTANWALISAAGVLDMVANLAYLEASRRGELSLVAVVSSLYPVSTVLLAFTLDRERVTRLQSIGMGAALAALLLISSSA
jgi:drug/metabolite transporter (DMT)-like permease